MKKIFMSILFILILLVFFTFNTVFAIGSEYNSLLITEVNLLTNEEKNFEVTSDTTVSEISPYIPESFIEPFSVIDNDDRQLIRDTNSHPYRCIGRLITTYADGTTGYGTAFLISKNIIMTAGHCIVSQDHGKPTSVVFFPGAMGPYNNPYGNGKGIKYVVPDGWSSYFKKDYDWGLIVLNTDFSEKCGWMGVRAYDDYNACKNLYVTISGYPTYDSSHPDISVEWQYKASGTISGASEYLLNYKIDMTQGQSGAPIFPADNYAIGINTREYNFLSKNEGNRITSSMMSTIKNTISNNNS